MFLEQVWVIIADVDQFECVFNGDFVPAGEVVHEELDEIEEVSGFEAGIVEDAALVHECELVLVDFSVEILVDFPDPLVHFGLAVGEVEFGEHADDVLLVDRQSTSSQNYGFLL